MGSLKRQLAIKSDGRRSSIRYKGIGKMTSQVIPGLANNQLPDIDSLSNKVLKEFMPIFSERLRKNLNEFQIGVEGDLDDSFHTSVNGRTGTLRFNFYGRFVDMGVGKGVTLAERQSNRQVTSNRTGLTSKRTPKPWFSRQYAYERARLGEIMTQHLKNIAEEVATNLPTEIPINL